MIGEGFFAISFEGLLGLIITVMGIWLVVRQLYEAKLASQMGGLLTLEQMALNAAETEKPYFTQLLEPEWLALSPEEAHAKVFGDADFLTSWSNLVAWNDLLGVLVRRGALDEDLVYLRHGQMTYKWWQLIEKTVRVEREKLEWPALAANWEWLALRFSKRK